MRPLSRCRNLFYGRGCHRPFLHVQIAKGDGRRRVRVLSCCVPQKGISFSRRKARPALPSSRATRAGADDAAPTGKRGGRQRFYLALKRRYSPNFKNKGKIYLSQRTAMIEIG